MDRDEIVIKAEWHVRGLYQAHFKPEFVYHNLDHAKRVVKAARQIADHYQLKEEDASAVFIACWFHDTGYLFDSNEHEAISAELAISFLEQEKAHSNLIKKVQECIQATKIFCSPPSLIAKIVADADLFHFGTDDFRKNNLLMKHEMELRYGKEIPSDKWQKGALRLLEKHRFFTDYCQKNLHLGKERNIFFLREDLGMNSE